MKKLLALLVFLLSIFTFIEVSHATVTLEKKVIVKNLILAKSELRKNVSNAESYITELDSFFEKYKDDSEKLE